jgi:hypothetical protein
LILFIKKLLRKSKSRRSLQPSKENIQHFKLNYFRFLWVIFEVLDPDPLTCFLIQSGSGSVTQVGGKCSKLGQMGQVELAAAQLLLKPLFSGKNRL